MTLTYNYLIQDGELRIELLPTQLTVSDRINIKRSLAVGDSEVTIDFTAIPVVKALLIVSDQALDIKINGQVTKMKSLIFTLLDSLTSLTVKNLGATAANLSIYIWGNAS